MALHFWPAIKVVTIGGKLTWVLYRAHQKGWDPQQVGWTLIDDARVVFGVGKRSFTFTTLLYHAYNAQTWVDGVECHKRLIDIANELESDGTLPERKVKMRAHIESLQRVVLSSVGFHLSMRTPREGEAREALLSESILGLYIYGRTGNRFADNAELGHVCMKLITLIQELDRDFDREVRSILTSPIPQYTSALRNALLQLPEMKSVQAQSGDAHAVESVLYALNMDVGQPEPVSGRELFQKLLS